MMKFFPTKQERIEKKIRMYEENILWHRQWIDSDQRELEKAKAELAKEKRS